MPDTSDRPSLDARVREELTPLLRRLRGPEAAVAMAELRPRDEDYARVFVDGERARAGYAALWERPQPPRIDRERTAIDVFVATTEQLVGGRADDFPGGYARLGGVLQPGLTWVAWRYRREGERAGTLFDGLVGLDDRWAWFPKPWRFAQPAP